MYRTTHQIYDYETILIHPDYKTLIYLRDANQQFNWLDFNMTPEDQVKLYNLGAEKALNFLIKFDWEAYKIIRAK